MEPTVIDADTFASVTLRDGRVVELHAMRVDDAAGLLQFHHGLSMETTYRRFFAVHPELSAPELERFTHVDHHDREAIVATVGDEIVGVARFDRLIDPEEAEVAFVVTDRWQGNGLGSALLDRLVQRARAEGVSRLVAETLADNWRMVAVFTDAGLPVRIAHRDGVVHVELDLSQRP
jgi:GNAT superfamily N-acetyltransferase